MTDQSATGQSAIEQAAIEHLATEQLSTGQSEIDQSRIEQSSIGRPSVGPCSMPASMPVQDDTPDLERRFGGLRRLYGDIGYARVRAARVAVVGLGGVGSWAVEALARSGVAALTLIDLDHVSESNINRQVQAIGATVGQAKAQALRLRIQDIHPGCRVTTVEEFVDADNWPSLLASPVDAVIDACDQVRAKAVIAAWAVANRIPTVVVGAAGGKRHAQQVEVADLAAVTHDPLLASLRHRLRRFHGGASVTTASGTTAIGTTAIAGTAIETHAIGTPALGARKFGLPCVFSREAVTTPNGAAQGDGSLNCHGYGSTVSVTATFGMVASGAILNALIDATRSDEVV